MLRIYIYRYVYPYIACTHVGNRSRCTAAKAIPGKGPAEEDNGVPLYTRRVGEPKNDEAPFQDPPNKINTSWCIR